MDRIMFAEKLAQMELDADSFEIKRLEWIHHMSKYDAESQKRVANDISLFIRVNAAVVHIPNDNELFTKLTGIVENFLDNNTDKLKECCDDELKTLVAEKTEATEVFLPRFRDWRFFNKDYRIRLFLNFLQQIEVMVSLFSDILAEDEKASWIICYYFILLHAIERFAREWENIHPQFADITSKSTALDAYMQLDGVCSQYTSYVHVDFGFICWIFYKSIEQKSLYVVNKQINLELTDMGKNIEASKIKEKLLQSKEAVIKQRPAIGAENAPIPITIKLVDKYSGAEFEAFIGSLFEADGYQVEFTQASNDKGIDVIAKRNGISIGIQCKRYSSAVGISSVQEVFSGKNFYSLDKALVVTNNTFTKAARDLADSTDVVLWDRTILDAKIRLVY